ncbi:MAG TPA: hypothetical protein VJH92_05095 [Candidatus Nanoarchaeia archaeon]|nr:hypothetical protein [Candidatus Nanoarchaeia archaeon]
MRINYFGKPLDTFRDEYGNDHLSRWELAKINPALYKRLLRHHEIDQAIPEVKHGYQKGHAGRRAPPPNVIEGIIQSHQIYDSARETAKHFPVCHKTVIKIWDKNNLPLFYRRPGNNNSYKTF